MTTQARPYRFGRRDNHGGYPVYTGDRRIGHVYHDQGSWWAVENYGNTITPATPPAPPPPDTSPTPANPQPPAPSPPTRNAPP